MEFAGLFSLLWPDDGCNESKPVAKKRTFKNEVLELNAELTRITVLL
jgi:hypothetical protein